MATARERLITPYPARELAYGSCQREKRLCSYMQCNHRRGCACMHAWRASCSSLFGAGANDVETNTTWHDCRCPDSCSLLVLVRRSLRISAANEDDVAGLGGHHGATLTMWERTWEDPEVGPVEVEKGRKARRGDEVGREMG